MNMRFLSSHLEVQSGFEPIFQGSSLEELWSHSDLQTFKTKKDRDILTLELDSNTFFVKRYHGPGVGFLHYFLRGFRDRYGPEVHDGVTHTAKRAKHD